MRSLIQDDLTHFKEPPQNINASEYGLKGKRTKDKGSTPRETRQAKRGCPTSVGQWNQT